MTANDLQDRLLGIPMYASSGVDVYSGVARASGRIWGREVRAIGPRPSTAVVLVHPTSNFLGHYLLERLAPQGVAAIGLCTRYVGNDSTLLMENCVLDVAATVKYLREDGYDNVVLLGNSGGGGLAPLYQSQARHATITAAPGGGGPDLTKADLSPADALILLNAHPSRALLRTEWLDPAITDESQPFDRDPELDMFDERHGPPFSDEFMKRFRAAQVARNHRISAQARLWLEEVDKRFDGQLNDFPFVVHGTTADPRFLDLSIDANDRAYGATFWGPPAASNYLPASLGHYCSARSWLSQWSLQDSHAGVHNIKDVEVPVLLMTGTGDPSVLPSHVAMFEEALTGSDYQRVDIPKGTHYFQGQPELMDLVAQEIGGWLRSRRLA